MKKYRFPSISRVITDLRQFNPKKVSFDTWSIVFFVIVLGLIMYTGVKLVQTILIKQAVDADRQKLLKEVDFWQGVVKKYPGYRDAYLTLAAFEYRLQDYAKARTYLQKALSLDPNSEKGKQLEKILNK